MVGKIASANNYKTARGKLNNKRAAVIYSRLAQNEIIKTPMIYCSPTIMSGDDTRIFVRRENKYR